MTCSKIETSPSFPNYAVFFEICFVSPGELAV